MPRQTPSTYISHHHQLKTLWQQKQQAFSFLTPQDQLTLHKYFLFALDKTNQELLDHRHNAKIADPSLVNRAGKAYAKLARAEPAPVKNFVKGHDGRRIYIRTVMHPEPNIELLSRALLMLAEQDSRSKSPDREEK
ncbi:MULTISPECIES: hypothetical protein [Nocardia]|uniref:hypothetical protein n=1 Tax=Nocardia TaxID=1817 RepID=UPI0024537A45|nr:MULTISPECIES: hypothetical protein [Nocardia]